MGPLQHHWIPLVYLQITEPAALREEIHERSGAQAGVAYTSMLRSSLRLCDIHHRTVRRDGLGLVLEGECYDKRHK